MKRTGALFLLPWIYGCAAAPPDRSPLALVDRSPDAIAGSALLPLLLDLSPEERRTRLRAEFLSGNVPRFLRRFVPVRSRRADARNRMRDVTFFALPDYLALGSDADHVRIPIPPTLAQELADRWSCSLPTRRMVDDIWRAAPTKLTPVTFSPAAYDITSLEILWRHHTRIEAQRPKGPRRLVAGIKKDVVVTPRLGARENRVAIYGWHRPDGRPIQPLYCGHVEHYVDYSHGVRLVRDYVLVDGERIALAKLLASPVLHPLLSDEGPVVHARYDSGARGEAATTDGSGSPPARSRRDDHRDRRRDRRR